MTTAWCNMYGLHEEQFNILIVESGYLLWSAHTAEDQTMYSFGEEFTSDQTLTNLHKISDL